MDALELAYIADALSIEIPIREWVDNEPKNAMTDIAAMLRQQQAEISLLQEYVCQLESGLESSLNLNKVQAERNTDNEPVAWTVDGVLFTSLGAALNISFDIKQPCIPLYTHPAKTLTDEEIQAIAKESYVWNTGKQEWSEIEFARAILKKAKEK